MKRKPELTMLQIQLTAAILQDSALDEAEELFWRLVEESEKEAREILSKDLNEEGLQVAASSVLAARKALLEFLDDLSGPLPTQEFDNWIRQELHYLEKSEAEVVEKLVREGVFSKPERKKHCL